MRLSRTFSRSASLLLRFNHRFVSNEAASFNILQRQEVNLLANIASVNLTHLNSRPVADEINHMLARQMDLLKTKVFSKDNSQVDSYFDSSSKASSISSLTKALRVCHETIDLDLLVEMCFSWYEIQAFSLFHRGIRIISDRNFDQLSTDQFSKLMLLIALKKEKMSLDLSRRIERYFKDHMKEMSLQQIALYCYAFFRTQTQPSDDEAISFILEQTFTQSSDKEIVSSSLLKFLRFIKMKKSVSQLRSLYEKLDANTLNLNEKPYLLVNLMKLGEYYFVYNKSVCERSLQTLPQMSCRIKDLAETLRCCLGMAHLPDDKTLQYFAKKQFSSMDLAKYSFVIAYATYCAYLGIVRDDLISRVLPYTSPRKLRYSILLISKHELFPPPSPARGNYGYAANLLRLHSLLSILHPTKYQGILLTSHQIDQLNRLIAPHDEQMLMQQSQEMNDNKTLFTSKKLFEEATAVFGERVFLHRTLPFCANPDICIAHDARDIRRIKEAPLSPSSVTNCLLLSIRQGGHFADWRHTRHRYDNQVREQMLSTMGYQVETFFWADIIAATSVSLRRHLGKVINTM